MNEQNQTIAPGQQPVAPVQPAVPAEPAPATVQPQVAPAPVQQPVQAQATIAPSAPVNAAPMEQQVASVPPTEQQMAPVPPVMQPVDNVVPPMAEEKSKKKPTALIVLLVLVVLAVGGFFVAKSFLVSPKNVFKAAINETYKAMSNVIETVDEKFEIGDKAVQLSGTMKIDSSSPETKEYGINDITFNGAVGIDTKNKEMLLSLGAKGKTEKVEGTVYLKEGYTYLKTTFYDQVLKLTEAGDIDFNDIKEMFDKIDKTEVDPKLYDSIVAAFTNALSDSLDESAMSKKSTSIKIAGKKYNVTKHSYTLNEKQTKKFSKALINNLLKDAEFIKNVAKAASVEESEVRKELEETLKDIDVTEVSKTNIINVYTKGLLKTEMLGVDVIEDKDTTFSYYHADGNLEISLGEELVFTVENKGKTSEAKISSMGTTYVVAEVRSFTKEKWDFDYEIKLGSENPSMGSIKGTVYFTNTETKNSISGDYKFRIEVSKEHFEISGTYAIESKDKLEGFEVSNAKSYDDIDEQAFLKSLTDALDKDEALKKAKTIIEDYMASQQPTNNYDDDYDDDSYDEEDLEEEKEEEIDESHRVIET